MTGSQILTLTKASRGIESLFNGLKKVYLIDPILGPQAVNFLAANENLTGLMVQWVWITECNRSPEDFLIRVQQLRNGEITVAEFAGKYLGGKNVADTNT